MESPLLEIFKGSFGLHAGALSPLVLSLDLFLHITDHKRNVADPQSDFSDSLLFSVLSQPISHSATELSLSILPAALWMKEGF